MSPSICPEPIHAAPPEHLAPTSSVTDPNATPSTATMQPAPATSTLTPSPSNPSSSAAPLDWSRVRLGVDPAPTMFVAHWSLETGGRWDGGALVPYGPLNLLPAAQVLNYGQSIFEGMKAYRADCPPTPTAAADGGGSRDSSGGDDVLLFRPDANAARFAAGALRMCMPPVPPALFLEALQAVVRANVNWVPPSPRGSLYLRPLLMGTGPLLGLCPAPSYTFVVYAVPVGGRAKEGRLTALDYLIHDSLHRAAPRGVGSTKAAGNYSPCLMAQAQAREQGCHDCIYLDAKSDQYLEEGSGCNVFVAHGSVVTTPPAAGSILPGVTRASLLQLAAALGYRAREAQISVEDAMKADEMFATGTAVVVQPIGSLTYRGARTCFGRQRPQQLLPPQQQQQPVTQEAQPPAPSAGVREERVEGGDAEAGANGQPSGDAASSGDVSPATTASGYGNGLERSGSSTISRDSGLGSAESRSDGCSESGAECLAGFLAPETPTRGQAGDGTEEDDVSSYVPYGYGRTVSHLTAEQRAELAAAAPAPDPASLPPGVGPIAQRLYGLLTSIQYGRAPDPFGWTVRVAMEGPQEGPLHLDRLLGLLEDEDEERVDAEVELQEEAGSGRPSASVVSAGGKGGVRGIPPVGPMDSFGRAASGARLKGAMGDGGLTPAQGTHGSVVKRGAAGKVLGGRSPFADPNLE